MSNTSPPTAESGEIANLVSILDVYERDEGNSGTDTESHELNVEKLKDHEVSSTARKLKFSWFHIPVNDTKRVKDCMAAISSTDDKIDADTQKRLENSWDAKRRPPMSLPKALVPDHSQFMEPSCESHDFSRKKPAQKGPIISFFLPYLNWETYKRFRQVPESLSSTHHRRRTLDQFYYPGLRNTSKRDAGQTVSKWTGPDTGNNGRDKAVDDSLLVMVDQLWLWILSDESILSSFPSGTEQFRRVEPRNPRNREAPPHHPATSVPTPGDFTDAYASIKDGSIEKCKDVYDLAFLIIKQTMTVVFEQENKKSRDLLGIYRWAITNKEAQQIECVETLGEPQSDLESGSLDDAAVLKLSLEVADILDELNMLSLLMENQRDVLATIPKSLQEFKPKSSQKDPESHLHIEQTGRSLVNIYSSSSAMGSIHLEQYQDALGNIFINSPEILPFPTNSGIGDWAGELIEETKRELFHRMDEVLRLKADAQRIHKSLLDLLDLRSKAASLAEARSSTKQGRVIMLFTIVTIIFLPLSFFTSYFGQNVSELTGDDLNPTSARLWKIGAPISVVVIVEALLIACYIVKLHTKLWIWISRKVLRWDSGQG